MKHRRSIAGVVTLALAASACAAGGDTIELARAEAPAPTSTTATSPVAPDVPLTIPAPSQSIDPVPARITPAAALPTEVFAERPRRATRWTPPVTGEIEIPRIGLKHTTYEGYTLKEIDFGPSHWPRTAMPGQPGNTVFPGHRTTKTRPFYYIDELEPGDEVIFRTADGVFTYHVTETLIVTPKDLWIIDPTEEPTFTIFACNPRGSARQRIVVKGVLVDSQLTNPPPPPPPPAPEPPPTTTTTTTRGLLDQL